MYAKKGSNVKVVATLLAIVLLIGCGIGGTIAWLKDETSTITNTFTTSDISITLSEQDPADHTAKMVPGATITKNPKVSVTTDSEDCYVFVKIEKSDNFDSYIEWSVATGWTELTEDSGIYWRKVLNKDTVREFSILEGDTVKVSTDVTKDMMTTAKTSVPSIAFTAYAIQSANLTSSEMTEIWSLAQNNPAT